MSEKPRAALLIPAEPGPHLIPIPEGSWFIRGPIDTVADLVDVPLGFASGGDA